MTKANGAGTPEETPAGPNGGEASEADEPTIGDLIHAEAQGVVKTSVIAAMAVGLVPMPVIDIVGVTGVSMTMLRSLAALYEVPFSENLGKSALVALVPSVLPVVVLGGAASVIKAFPGPGTAGGIAGVTVLSGAVVYALGQVFIQHFEAGGTMADFNPGPAKTGFKQAFEDGKKVVRELMAQINQPPAAGQGPKKWRLKPHRA